MVGGLYLALARDSQDIIPLGTLMARNLISGEAYGYLHFAAEIFRNRPTSPGAKERFGKTLKIRSE
jgi:hypothetical protein